MMSKLELALKSKGKSSTPTTTSLPIKNTSETSTKSSSTIVSSYGNISVGDKVQIREGAIDVTTGTIGTGLKKRYQEAGPMWATVTSINTAYKTRSKVLPDTVVKVQCSNDAGVVVWQVQPSDICPQIIKATKADVLTGSSSNFSNPKKLKDLREVAFVPEYFAAAEEVKSTNTAYAPDGESEEWYKGNSSTVLKSSKKLEDPVAIETAHISDSVFDNSRQAPQYKKIIGNTANSVYESEELFKTVELLPLYHSSLSPSGA